jgi:hypothetical protein
MKTMPSHFTFQSIKKQYETALKKGYQFITCEQFSHKKIDGLLNGKLIVNRVDIDFSVKKAEKLIDIFIELDIKASFFVRLHASEYNPFSFENYRIIKKLLENKHELGYHSEVIDQSVIWNENAEDCLKRDIDIINRMFNTRIVGIASHGGMTGLNNLDFWQEKKAADFNLLYEAYDTAPHFDLFNNSFYISDSEWTRWKCYNKGKLVEGDTRTFEEHLIENHDLIYLLIHSDTFFNNHYYEE